MKKPVFKKLNSSQIKGYHHDQKKQNLILEFKSNRYYAYWPITKEDVEDFLNAKSQGKYFHEHFKSNPDLLITEVSFNASRA